MSVFECKPCHRTFVVSDDDDPGRFCPECGSEVTLVEQCEECSEPLGEEPRAEVVFLEDKNLDEPGGLHGIIHQSCFDPQHHQIA